MNEIVVFVKNVTLLLLLGNILTSLFGGSSYRKYFHYVIGLIVLVMAAAPVLSFFSGEEKLTAYLEKSVMATEENRMGSEIRLATEEAQEKIREEYKETIAEIVRKECSLTQDECWIEVVLSKEEGMEGQIQTVTVHVDEMPVRVTRHVSNLSLSLGIQTEQIEFMQNG